MTDSTADKTTDKEVRGSGLRRGILFSLLAIMIVALIYDYQVARPNVNAAYEVLLNENQRLNAKPQEFLSNTDVQNLLDKKPASTFEDGTSFVEVYEWAGGIPGRPHSLFAVYKDRDDQHMFYRQAKFVYESSSYVAPIPEVLVSERDPMMEALYEAEMTANENGASSEQGMSPELLMTRLDVNKDGELTGDEIPSYISQDLPRTDTDGNKSISLAEISDRLAEHNSQRQNAITDDAATADSDDPGRPALGE